MTENPSIKILEVQKLSINSESLLGFAIDSPKGKQKLDTYSISIAGWVIGKTSPALAVEFLCKGKVLQKVPVGKPRPGVQKRYPKVPEAKRSGFAAAVGVVGLPLTGSLRIRVILSDGSTVPITDIKFQHQPLNSGYEPKLQPLVVSSSGRSGTTWFMRLLSQNPAIVTCEIYAYETRVWPFWMQLLQFLSQRANPIETPFPADYPPKAAAFCQQTLDGFYQHLAEAQGKIINPSQLSYFAEKNNLNQNINLLMEIYPLGKEIILVRDFRDVASSVLAFNKKRGSEGFGRQKFKNDQEYVKNVIKNIAIGLQSRWKKRKKQARLVRYEDLILSPEETLGGVLEYLKLDSSPEAIAKMISKASEDSAYTGWHKTSSSAKDSIGRWRQDLDPSLQKVCNKVLADSLREFGYPPN
ncbi:MAG: sulfotransferase [Cyanobacteriota bacterium]|nr:sulfotransferase [Cyanobacteriota bacterium]